MKICFLCGSIEPGKNGVGDYARRLAGELIRSGHEAYLVGLEETELNAPIETEQQDEGTPVPTHRWPVSDSWKKRFEALEQLLAQTAPTHLSVQFVPYAFDPRGLPFAFSNRLLKLKTSARWHFTIHELWHQSAEMTGKQRIISYLQSRIIRRLLRSASPAPVHTSLERYQKLLADMQVPSKCLPIFSNIQPLTTPPALIPTGEAPRTQIHAAFFSQCTIQPAVADFVVAFHEDCLARGKALNIRFIGGSQAHVEAAMEALRARSGDDLILRHTGRLDAGEVSRQLDEIDFGISPVPRHVIGKSGSTAAFLAHGKAVAIPHTEAGESPGNIGFTVEALRLALFTEPTLAAMKRSTGVAHSNKQTLSLESVAARLIEDLQAAPHPAQNQSTDDSPA